MYRTRAACVLLIILASLVVTACPPPTRTIAFTWDGETFRRRETPGVTAPAPQDVQQADLDGDGALETVELQWNKLRLVDDGQTAWRSDPAWTVTRFALTDIDNGGAPDIFFTVWKPDEAGALRCHPFIYGWDRDAWRPRWFGSAVADPIADFVVGDVDGDGRNELVVLEARYGDPEKGDHLSIPREGRYVAVWRFNQWWFQFLWRSEPGAYWNLGLKDVTGDNVPDIVTNSNP
ncbi:MAG: hypothetical protein KKA73_16245 [Chloroflexi bacterium]|nr:hypothetical protein [Chloroflexota bacterium]MBU1749237.1 hypothetical protein [Chloroflexota bacterium]